jgi:hypothetical protein
MPLLVVLLMLALSAQAQTNHSFTTNWIAAPANYRVISNQVYDANLSQKWQTISVPPGARCAPPTPGPPGSPSLIMLWPSELLSISIVNFPYDARDYTYRPYYSQYSLAHGFSIRAFPISASTNWGEDGKPRFIVRTYDYGLRATNKIPVVTRR